MSKQYKIWRYGLNITDTQTIPMQKNAKIMSVAMMECGLCIWVRVENDSRIPNVDRGIIIHGTGHMLLEPDVPFIGTVIDNRMSLPLVWHVFDGGEI